MDYSLDGRGSMACPVHRSRGEGGSRQARVAWAVALGLSAALLLLGLPAALQVSMADAGALSPSPAALVVTDPGDSGPGTLRWALAWARARARSGKRAGRTQKGEQRSVQVRVKVHSP